MAEIFPYLLARVASEPIDDIEQFLSVEAELNDWLAIGYKLAQERESNCEAIFKAFKRVQKANDRLVLIEVKRNIFNQRDSSAEALTTVKKYLSSDEQEKLEVYTKWLHEYDQKQAQLLAAFDLGIAQNRTHLKQLIQNKHFKNGLLLSSSNLLDQLEVYFAKSPELFRKKDLQVELSLLKYLTRMYTKTSPFGTFTNLGIESPHWLPGSAPTALNLSSTVSSHIQINHLFLAWLEQEIRLIRSVGKWFELKLNPSLRKVAHQYVFYVNADSQSEDFHKITVDPLLEYIVELLKGTGFKDAMHLGELVAMLLEQVDAEEEDLENYLYRLVSLGLLEIHITPPQKGHCWERVLTEALREKIVEKSPFVCLLIKQLDQLSICKKQYTSADFTKRSVLLKKIHTIIEGIISLVKEQQITEQGEQETSPKVSEGLRNNMLYEDTFRTTNLLIHQAKFKQLAEKIYPLAEQSLQGRLRHFSLMDANSLFLAKYAKEDRVPFLDFFEEYYIQIIQNKRTELANNEQFVQHLAASKNTWKHTKQSWQVALYENIQMHTEVHHHQVNLNVALLEKLQTVLPAQPKTKKFRAAFLQFFNDQGTTKAFLNALTIGYGKMYSRFLNDSTHTLVTEGIKDWNKSLADSAELLIENRDGSSANANIHPRLMPAQIQLNHDESMQGSTTGVTLDQLAIRYNTHQEEIELVHLATGKVCRVFDLDFQVIDQRSEMFKFLAIFDPTTVPLYFDIIDQANKVHAMNVSGSEIQILPRITFESDIILQRKTWVIPAKLLPANQTNQLSAYFLAVNKWANQLGLPRKVFMRMDRQDATKSIAHPNRDLYKPQFVDFSNPLIFRIFDKMVKKIKTKLIIEEALPLPDQYLKAEQKAFASEFLIQWMT